MSRSLEKVLNLISRKKTIANSAITIESIIKREFPDHVHPLSDKEFKVKVFFCLLYLGYNNSEIERLQYPLMNGTKGDYFKSYDIYEIGVDALKLGATVTSFVSPEASHEHSNIYKALSEQNMTLSQFLRAGYSYGQIVQSFKEVGGISESEASNKFSNLFANNTEIPQAMAKRLVAMFSERDVPAQLLRNKGLIPAELLVGKYSLEDVMTTVPRPTYEEVRQHATPEQLIMFFSNDILGESNMKSLSNSALAAAGYNPLALKYQEYMAKFYYQRGKDCVCGGINNSEMQGNMPMPQKFDPSDGGNSFAAGRQEWVQNVPSNFGYNIVSLNKAYDSMHTPSRGGKPIPKNDASSVIQMRRISALGKGSADPAGYTKSDPLSFASSNSSNINTIRQARRRTRSSGYVVPPKVYRASQCGH